jgi:CHAD domain-containing protein
MRCEDPYALAAARVVAVRADELIEHSAGVLDTGDIERVHDMRVASRRLRAGMEIFEPCFPAKPFRKTLGAVKALADALGERRDRDVSLAALEEFGGKLTAPERAGVQMLIDRLREEQALANDGLAAAVAEERLVELRERIGELVEAAREEGS